MHVVFDRIKKKRTELLISPNMTGYNLTPNVFNLVRDKLGYRTTNERYYRIVLTLIQENVLIIELWEKCLFYRFNDPDHTYRISITLYPLTHQQGAYLGCTPTLPTTELCWGTEEDLAKLSAAPEGLFWNFRSFRISRTESPVQPLSMFPG